MLNINQCIKIKIPKNKGTFVIIANANISEEQLSNDRFQDDILNYSFDNVFYQSNYQNPLIFIKNSSRFSNIYLIEEHTYVIKFIEGSSCNNPKVFEHLTNHSSNEITFQLVNDYEGILNFKSYAGKVFFDFKDDDFSFSEPLEVRSKKIDYDIQYKQMIEDLSTKFVELIYNINGPLFNSNVFYKNKRETSYLDFIVLSYIFKEENLPTIHEYISKNIHSKLENYYHIVPFSLASKIDFLELIKDINKPENICKVSQKNSIIDKNDEYYTPLECSVLEQLDDIDTPENQFYKYFLEFIENLILDLISILDNCHAKDNLLDYYGEINKFLSQDYFKEISRINYLPLNSQVLQKKEGYREILQYYLMFELGFKISWDDLTNNFKSYQKQLYKIYEYWCFFELLDILEELTSSSISIDSFINKNDFSINLAENNEIYLFNPIYLNNNRIEISLLYNYKFLEYTSNRKNKKYSSYSIQLDPDFSIKLKSNDDVKFIHFDAKYKSKIDYKNNKSYTHSDIVKMHAYKDAINNSIGSFVLYPGNKNMTFPKNEYVGRVGAFCLNPGNIRDKNNLKKFIEKCIKFGASDFEIVYYKSIN